MPLPEDSLPPIFVSVKKAAELLDTTPWSIYQLLDAHQADPSEGIEGRYDGRRRKVVLKSLQDYAAKLPTSAPEKGATA